MIVLRQTKTDETPCLTSVCTEVILADCPSAPCGAALVGRKAFKNIPNRPLLAGVTVSAVHTWASQVILATGTFGSLKAETTAS